MTHTRRAIMTGLATAPLAAAATAAAITNALMPLPAPDPVFAVIERYRRAVAALEAADEKADPGYYAAASNEHIAACKALFNTVPSTHAGCLALIKQVLVDAEDEVGSDSHTTLQCWPRRCNSSLDRRRPSAPRARPGSG